MAVTSLTSRTLVAAATRRIAASSGAPVASGYDRALRPGAARVSPTQRTICDGGNC